MSAIRLDTPQPTDPMAAVRALNRMRRAGFSLELDGTALVVSPADHLTDAQRAFLRARKVALVQLLNDAETVYNALQAAGAAGLGWREGTPQEWPDGWLLACNEGLYSDGRMVSRNGRRYLRELAPVLVSPSETANIIPMDREAYEERAAIMEFDGGLQRGEAERNRCESGSVGEMYPAHWRSISPIHLTEYVIPDDPLDL